MWLMVMTFVPLFGFIAYLFLGQDYKKSKMFKLKETQDKFVKDISLFQKDFIDEGRPFAHEEETWNYADLIKMNLATDESFYTDDNQVDLFFWGKDKFKALMEDLQGAQKSIDIEYYIFKADRIGREIINILEKKARQGVKVRLLADGVGSRRLRENNLDGLRRAGGEALIFFPSLFRRINIKLNYRNHRKLVIIDNKIGYVGGFNVGDEYLGLDNRFGKWRDTHARIEGSGVLGLKFRFLKDWSYQKGKIDEEEDVLDGRYNKNGKSGVQIVTSGPDTEFENIKNSFFKMITTSKKSVYIQTPYFIPDESILDALKTAIISGIEVNVMIPMKPDHPFVFWASLSYLGDILRVGARVYLYEEGFLHGKVMIVDDYISTLGSANMDIRSFALNFEANAVIYDHAVNSRLKEQFFADSKKSKLLTYEEYLNRGKIVKIKEAFCRLFSPIL